MFVYFQIRNATAIHLLFNEAYYNYLNCLFPCHLNDVAVMGAIVMQIIFGDYNPKKSKNNLQRYTLLTLLR